MAQVIGEIANNGITIVLKPKLDEAERQKAEAEAILKNDANNQAAKQQLETANKTIKDYGQGSQIQLAVRAVTGVLQGIATGEASQAVVSGLSPYANYAIKKATTDKAGNVNTEANLMAHALLGAVEAYATDNNATAGAAGAVGGEVAAKIITGQLYQKTPDQLTEAQKQTVSALSQLASGLAGGLISDSTAGAINAAEIGKRAVEDNLLTNQEDEIIYNASVEYQRKGYLSKDKQILVGTLLSQDKEINRLLSLYQTSPNSLTYAQKTYLNAALMRISKANQIPIETLYHWDFSNTIERNDTALKTYLNNQNAINNSYDVKQAQSLKEALEFSALGLSGVGSISKGMEFLPKIGTIATKYPLATEMTTTAIANTGYQLTQNKTYDPYSLLQSELSTVLTRGRALGQQISINVGISSMATQNPNDYGWNALGAVAGTIGTSVINRVNFGNKYNNQLLKPIISGIVGEGIGDSNNWNYQYKNIKEDKFENIQK